MLVGEPESKRLKEDEEEEGRETARMAQYISRFREPRIHYL